ncbi:F510_1955 family glycosylhydrolase [Arthrobacter sp. MP_2.3]|uniref:F510_1955 family glycosylhydrolase n=1 Tax=Arthrobacter sp. MP_2.3 TaxID=3349633 RepID=UPI0038D49E79
MAFAFILRRPAATITCAAAALVVALSACSPAPTAPPQTGNDLPDAHIHGLNVNGETGQVLLATHKGLYDMSANPAVRVGPENDLMGFASAKDPGVFFASGHPGPGSSLPNPLGLIKSSDGGRTWEQLSRQRESDFHALTTTKSGIVAFDGALQTSPDGKTWQTATAGFQPATLAGNPYSDTVLATTADGVQRSTDAGRTWALAKSSPVIQFAAFADAQEAFGVEPGGAVHYSPDGGATWTRQGQVSADVQAIAATKGPDGKTALWAASPTALWVSTDGGATFHPANAS